MSENQATTNGTERQLENIRKFHARIKQLESQKAGAVGDHNDAIGELDEQLDGTMEQAMPGTSEDRLKLIKTMRQAYAALKSEKEAKAETRRAFNEQLKTAREALDLAILNSNQLGLFGEKKDDEASETTDETPAAPEKVKTIRRPAKKMPPCPRCGPVKGIHESDAVEGMSHFCAACGEHFNASK